MPLAVRRMRSSDISNPAEPLKGRQRLRLRLRLLLRRKMNLQCISPLGERRRASVAAGHEARSTAV